MLKAAVIGVAAAAITALLGGCGKQEDFPYKTDSAEVLPPEEAGNSCKVFLGDPDTYLVFTHTGDVHKLVSGRCAGQMATFGPRFIGNLERRAVTCQALSDYLHSGRDPLLNGVKVLCNHDGSSAPSAAATDGSECEVDFLPGHSTITLEFGGDGNGDGPTDKFVAPDLSHLTQFTKETKNQIDMVDFPAKLGGVRLDCEAIKAFAAAIGGFGRYVSHMNNGANIVETCKVIPSIDIVPAINVSIPTTPAPAA
ncbi:hypothetical protein FOZ61_004656 [Perkinsus olseni]|uniref:Superoxide dismutase [Cu-Zn] n=1 Tax=Perkinsus olseni TaxID=32597 RepID=A0A7J6LJX1_PEROL|nr:hypothetical protein FOZ61_004656 [Perkinsus olseni]KAF4663581.1 hypothetical protein FOL46_004659 [Perkinsus olseni]